MEYTLAQNHCLNIIRNVLLAICLLLTSLQLLAHELPDRIQVRLLIHEDEQAVHLLARLPLEAMRDFDFPVRGPGYLKFSESLPLIHDAVSLWLLDEISLYQGDVPLAAKSGEHIRISLPSNSEFSTYDNALTHIQSQPLSDDLDLYWRQANVDIHVTYPLANDNSVFTLEANLAGLAHKTTSSLEFTSRDGTLYRYDFTGDSGSLTMNPGPLTVCRGFISRGLSHLTSSVEYLLFFVVLVAPITAFRSLVHLVLAFALGHSLTLSLVAFGIVPNYLWFPTFIDLLVALSILILAINNVFIRDRSRRWILGLMFGFVYGFAFSFALSDSLQYSGNHLMAALLGFNLGVGLSQALILSGILLLMTLMRRFLQNERMLLGILSLLAAHSSLHWIHEHWLTLSAYI